MPGKIAIVDYGVGNLKSVSNALRYIGLESVITADQGELERAGGVILPGVGAFPDAADRLRQSGLDRAVLEQGQKKPVLGICLGMQLLLERGEEVRPCAGLGAVRGTCRRIPTARKLPHIGWNSLDIRRPGGLFAGQGTDPFVYFVHSYYLQAEEDVVTATAEYGVTIHAAVEKGNLWACQFHPEKSGEAGLQMLRSFCGKVEQEVKIQRG